MMESKDIFQQWQDLIKRSLDQSTDNARRLNEQLRNVASGKQNYDGQRAIDLLREAPIDYARAVSQAWLAGYRTLLDLNELYAEGLAKAMGAAGAGAPVAAASRTPSEPIELTGLLGEVLDSKIVVDNSDRKTSLHVDVQIGELLDERQRGTGVQPSVSPSRLELAPGEDQQVTFSVELDPKKLRADQVYVATVTLRGRTEEQLFLRIVPQRKAKT